MTPSPRCITGLLGLGLSSLCTLLPGAATAAADTAPSAVVARIALPGETRWDYLCVDDAGRRLYVSHGTQTDVIDLRTQRLVGTVSDTPGVHGIAIAPALGEGYTSNGRDDTVTVFDLATLQHRATIHVGANPDAIVYAAASERVITFNGRSHDATVIDARTRAVIATVPLGGKPEFAQVGEGGRVDVNIEDTHEVAVLDPATASVLRRYDLPDCASPTGLAIDERHRLYAVCGNQRMVVSTDDGRVLGHAPIGAGADGVVWRAGRAYSANGADGTVTVVGETPAGDYEVLATLTTERGARTVALDPTTGRLYLPTADYAPLPAGADPAERRTPLPGSFHVLVLAPR